MTRALAIIAAFAAAALLAASPARADATEDCFGEDLERRIAGCTALIERGDRDEEMRSFAYGMRGLMLSIGGNYEAAIRDYDAAIALKPDFAVVLNNRAWAYFRWGRAAAGLADVEKSLQLNPKSPYAFDTRAHIRQALGDPEGALSDYEGAMRHGGASKTRLYQCGLQGLGLYKGAIDGDLRSELTGALGKCAHDKACEPLPPGEKCPSLP
jgi:tetratricopeptide (TPR) repeat protein